MPANADGEPVKDECEWIKAADASYLPTNEPKTIEFYVPERRERGRATLCSCARATAAQG